MTRKYWQASSVAPSRLIQKNWNALLLAFRRSGYNSQGHDLKEGVSDRYMRPEDIAKSNLLQRLK